jgi:hypothetical protein
VVDEWGDMVILFNGYNVGSFMLNISAIINFIYVFQGWETLQGWWQTSPL